MRGSRGRFTRQCGGKTAHSDRGAALRHASRIPGLMAYRCQHCRRWHVGGNNQRPQVRVSRRPEGVDNRRARRKARQRGYDEEVEL